MTNMEALLGIADHLIPVVLTLGVFLVIACLIIGSPYCHYVSLVSDADTDKGKEDLARHLASKAGGRKIDTNQSWRSFLPAARDLHKKHVRKKTSM